MKQIILGLMIGLAGITALVSGGTPLALVAPLATITFWEALGVISNLIVPIVGAIITVVIWLHRRLEQIEEDTQEVSSSVFGSEKDALNQGVLRSVQDLKERVDRMRNSVDRIDRRVERLEEKEDDD